MLSPPWLLLRIVTKVSTAAILVACSSEQSTQEPAGYVGDVCSCAMCSHPLGACPGDPQADTVANASDAEAGAPVDACMTDLASVSSACPASYLDVADAGCGKYVDEYRHGMCGAFLVYAYVVVASETECFYDSVSDKLVGILFTDDSPFACNGTSNSLQAGSVDTTCGGQSPASNGPPVNLPVVSCRSGVGDAGDVQMPAADAGADVVADGATDTARE